MQVFRDTGKSGFVFEQLPMKFSVNGEIKMEITQLNYNEYKGKKYNAEFHSDQYLSIEPGNNGFEMKWVYSETELKMSIHDYMLSDWLEDPAAYGAFENGRMVGFVEGFLEKWNNRFRITNICVFDESDRRRGIGTLLLDRMMLDAVNSGARMAVLETRRFN